MTLTFKMLFLPNIVLNISSEFVELYLSASEILNLSIPLLPSYPTKSVHVDLLYARFDGLSCISFFFEKNG